MNAKVNVNELSDEVWRPNVLVDGVGINRVLDGLMIVVLSLHRQC